MSQCETRAWGKCGHCGGSVAIKCNRSGLAYYRCDHCGAHVQHHWRRTSDKLLSEVGYQEKQAEQKPAEAPAAASQPAKPAKPEAKKPAPGSVASFLGLGG